MGVIRAVRGRAWAVCGRSVTHGGIRGTGHMRGLVLGVGYIRDDA